MKKSKVVVLPSEWEEAFGRVLIESIFNGTIAIGSDRGGYLKYYITIIGSYLNQNLVMN